jgi:gliding motility-associated-like protein
LASCIQSSASYNLSFEPPPTLSLQKIINTTFCDGQSVSLKATYSGGTIKWSTGETVDQINTKQTGIYTAMVSTAAGCTVSKDISVQFFPNPVLNIPDASLCQFTHQTITLTAPTGFAKYEWNGQAGTSTYVTGTLGKVTLKVTDNNGCTALQTINISIHCDDIHIPNTFTPNGDGINDKWEIAGLQGDESTIVKVYNRYGDLLFKNVGYSIPWDGTYKDKKLPAGVYYYVINTRGSNQVISGSVSIIY